MYSSGACVKSVKGVPDCRRHLGRLQSQTHPRTRRKDRNLKSDERCCSQSHGITAGESGSVRTRPPRGPRGGLCATEMGLVDAKPLSTQIYCVGSLVHQLICHPVILIPRRMDSGQPPGISYGFGSHESGCKDEIELLSCTS